MCSPLQTSESDNRVFNIENDLIKIDFGVQLDGVIIDNAVSRPRNKEYIDLLDALAYGYSNYGKY